MQLRCELLLSGLCRWEQLADGDVSQRTGGFIKSNVSSHHSCRGVSRLACGRLFELLLHNLVTLKLCNYRTRGRGCVGGKSKMAAALIPAERFLHVRWHGCEVAHTRAPTRTHAQSAEPMSRSNATGKGCWVTWCRPVIWTWSFVDALSR